MTKDFRGILNEEGLVAYNQALFDNMACFTDVVWCIDLDTEQVEIMCDNIEPERAGKVFSLEAIREDTRKRYPGDSADSADIVDRYTVEFMRELKETKIYDNPVFISNGKKCKLKQALSPELDENGITKRVYVSCTNIQEYVQALESEYEKRAILDHFVRLYTSAYIVNLADGSFEILHMNHDFSQVFVMNGTKTDMDKFVLDHVHPEDQEKMWLLTDRHYMRKIMETTDEYTFNMREVYGEDERVMHVLVMKTLDSDRVAIGFMDITAELQKEKEINRRLEAANNAKRDFLSTMSHDIRTPMNAIIGMVDIAMNHTGDEEKVKDSLNKIRTSGNQLIALVNDILDISAIDSGKMEIKPVPHSVVAGGEQVKSSIQGMLGSKKLNIEYEQHDILVPWIMVDELRLNQIVYNLLSNAIKYTPEGGTVRLENWQERGENDIVWENVRISDTGIGMSEKFMETMWETFTRAVDSRVDKIQGAGLGLSIVKKFTELMGGEITAESEIDKGSVFTFRFPVDPAEPEEIDDREAAAEGTLDCRVLVVEDNDMNWEIAYELLKMRGVESERAVNGLVGVQMFTETPAGTYDAILMDMQMPVMDGLEATRQIRASKHPEAKSIPILAMTANAFAEDVEACKAAGMNEHLSKPIDMDIVIGALRKYTGGVQESVK